MVPTNLIFIIGGSGTGKTTLARALQERLLPDQWFHISPDTLFYCLPKSIVDRADSANDWSAVDTKLVTELAYSCVREALRSGARALPRLRCDWFEMIDRHGSTREAIRAAVHGAR